MRKPMFLLAFAGLLLFVGACENDSREVADSGDFAPMMMVGLNSGDECEWTPPTPEILADLEWETFEGSLLPGYGGFLLANSTTWGPGCSFSIQVPPDALPGSPGDPRIPVSISFPTKDSYLRYEGDPSLNCGVGLPLILEMEPHGINFLEPLIVYATYMPWTDVTAEDIQSSSWWHNDPTGPYELLWVKKGKRGIVTFAFKAWHFSRWDVGGPEPPIPPPTP